MSDRSVAVASQPTSAAHSNRSVRVAMDVTSLLGQTSGVGTMVSELATHLGSHDDLDLTGIVVSRNKRHDIDSVLPDGWRAKTHVLPAQLAHWLWRHTGRPRLRGFDVVHGPNYIVAPAKEAGRLVTVHDLTAWRFPNMVNRWCRFFPEQLERAVNGGAHVHAVSQYVRRELVELGVPEERLHVVANGVTKAPEGSRRRALKSIGAPYVLALGTIEPRKDHVGLISAMADVWAIDPGIKLVIAGGKGWNTEAVDAAIDRLGVRDKVRFSGYVDEQTKADLLAGAELLAFPSIYEGFGMPILEAMSAGLPVVATTAGAIPEVAGQAAMLVEPRNHGALSAAIISVLEDSELRRKLVSAGRQQCAKYRWDRSASELAAIYRHLSLIS